MAKASTRDLDRRPDSDFAYVAPGGKKDSEGKTVPRSLRKLPIYDKEHAQNALARFDKADIPADAKARVKTKIVAAAKKFGIKVSESTRLATASAIILADGEPPGTRILTVGSFLKFTNRFVKRDCCVTKARSWLVDFANKVRQPQIGAAVLYPIDVLYKSLCSEAGACLCIQPDFCTPTECAPPTCTDNPFTMYSVYYREPSCKSAETQ